MRYQVRHMGVIVGIADSLNDAKTLLLNYAFNRKRSINEFNIVRVR